MPTGTWKSVGTAITIAGGLLMIVFVPLRYWMALIGLMLVAAGIYIRMNS